MFAVLGGIAEVEKNLSN